MTSGREATIARLGASLAGLYFAWLGFSLWRAGGAFRQMLLGLGSDIPPLTQFVLDHRGPVFITVFGTAVLGLAINERLVADKRQSLMITMVLVIVVRWIVDAFLTVYYLPLFDLIAQLS